MQRSVKARDRVEKRSQERAVGVNLLGECREEKAGFSSAGGSYVGQPSGASEKNSFRIELG